MTPAIIITIALTLCRYIPAGLTFSCNYWEDEHSNIHANCSRRNFKLIPVVSSNVIFFDLSYNSIKVVKNNTFSYLSFLQELNLELNNLIRLEQGAFSELHHLKRLILGYNFLSYRSQHFSKSVFKPLKSLAYLHIGYQMPDKTGLMQYKWFSKYVISDLTSLQSIEMDLVTIRPNQTYFPSEFMLLTKLKKIKTGLCVIDEVNNKIFSNVPNKVNIDLSECEIGYYESGTLQGLNLEYLYIQHLTGNLAVPELIIYDIPKNPIQTLVITNIEYPFQIISLVFNALNKTGLQNLYLNHHSVMMDLCANYVIEVPSTLKVLDLSFNDLKSVCLCMPNLKNLNLERNNLGDFFLSNTYHAHNCSSNPTNLIDINLSHNSLFYLKVSIFNGHRCLLNLNLSNNLLTDINFDLSHLKSLKVLDLSNNRIAKFSRESMEQLNFVFDSSDIRINLAGNILQCSCDALQFIKWILEKEEYFSNTSEIKCKFLNETEIFLTDFRGTMMKLKKKCASRLVLIISVAVAITSIIIVAIIGIVYRYRWRLRYIYYMTKSKYLRDNLNQNDDRNYTYDAFISYSDDEQDFVLNECIPILEERGNVKLCVHKRDFLPGREIFHNITTSIHESRTVICIITKSFLGSYYCMFEFNMARMESIYARHGKNMLFLVFYEQLRTKDIPLVMLELVEKYSYIEYPNDEQENIVFWNKLKEAMT